MAEEILYFFKKTLNKISNKVLQFLNLTDPEDFEACLKIIKRLGEYAGWKVFNDVQLTFIQKGLIRVGQFISVSQIIQNGVLTYIYRENFLQLLYNLCCTIMILIYSTHHITWINREAEVLVLFNWCQAQSDERRYSLINTWSLRLQEVKRQAWKLTLAFIFCFNFGPGFILFTGSTLVSLYMGNCILLFPGIVSAGFNVEFWKWAISLIEQVVYLAFLSGSVCAVYFAMYYTCMFLCYRFEMIIELIRKLGGKVTKRNRILDHELVETIIDLQVDAAK